MAWEGPYRLRELLDRAGGLDGAIIPESYGLYVFSLNPWEYEPTDLLYLGSGHATKNTNLRHRIGAQVASAQGFHGKVAGHGHGGILLSEYCNTNGINPLELYLGWRVRPTKDACPVPAEQELFAQHDPKSDDPKVQQRSPRLLNHGRPRDCGQPGCAKKP
jgi:hypothetical protein